MSQLSPELDRRLKRIEAVLDLLLAAVGAQITQEEHMDEVAQSLTAEIATLAADETADNAAIVAAGEAIANAGTQFSALKAKIESLSAGQTISDEELAALKSEVAAVDGKITTGTTELAAHAKQLSEAAAAA